MDPRILANFFVDKTLRFGKVQNRREIEAAYRNHFARWPIRAYVSQKDAVPLVECLAPGTGSVNVLDHVVARNEEVCTVSLDIDWEVQNHVSRVTGKAQETFTFLLTIVDAAHIDVNAPIWITTQSEVVRERRDYTLSEIQSGTSATTP
jgi:hypothetical protein